MNSVPTLKPVEALSRLIEIATSYGVQRQLHFPSILPQAKILLSKVGGSSD